MESKARLVFDRRVPVSGGSFAELVLRELPRRLPGSAHSYKYRLAYVVNGVCVLRFDNEPGKGDHMHVGDIERPYWFIDPERLVADFLDAVRRIDNEDSQD